MFTRTTERTSPQRSIRGRVAQAGLQFARRVHHDQQGTISIVTVFALLMFTMLLVMIVNSAVLIDDKLQMQNASDASAHSGGVILARGMNSVAFSNHLLCDVFALTAFLREGGERSAETLTPQVLEAWEREARTFSGSEFDKFRQLGSAMQAKLPHERNLVDSFGNMTEAASDFALPVMEAILAEEMIPEFQRVLIRSIPQLAQQTTFEVAYRHGLTRQELATLNQQRPTRGDDGRGQQVGMLWRMTVQPVGTTDEEDPLTRTLPVVETNVTGPDLQYLPNGEEYFNRAVEQRRQLSKYYLEQWNSDKLRMFDTYAEMSQFSNVWRIITCAQLEQLLSEYPNTNLPMVIRDNELGEENLADVPPSEARNVHLEYNYNFLSVVYRENKSLMGPGIFRNPIDRHSDALTFTQVSIFLPRTRRVLHDQRSTPPPTGLGGTFGFAGSIDPPDPPDQIGNDAFEPIWVSQGWPHHWDLLNQNWTAKIVPATATAIPRILSANPGGNLQGFRPPNLNGVSIEDINRVNTH